MSAVQAPLWRFVVAHWLHHLPAIAGALLTMLLATLISVTIPLAAKEVATYDGAKGQRTTADTAAASTPAGASLGAVTAALGAVSEHLFGATVRRVLGSSFVTTWVAEAEAHFFVGLVSRCLLMAVLVVSYHAVSLTAHLAAYRAGMAAHCSLVEHSLAHILSRRHPDRVAVVDPARLTHMVLSSAKTSCSVLGALLTDVTAGAFSAVGSLAVLLFISTKLTLAIGGMVGGVQMVYMAAGRHHNHHAARVAAKEAALSAQVNNAVARSETVFIFQSEGFVLGRLHATLRVLTGLAGELNTSIHGYAALSTASTTLVFVVVLGMSTYYHRKGELTLSDSALYFMFLQSFVSRVVSLTTDLSRSWVELGRLAALQGTLSWFTADADNDSDVASAERARADSRGLEAGTASPTLRAHVVRSDDPMCDVRLVGVSFAYPAVPAHLVEHLCGGGRGDALGSAPPTGGRVNGVCGVSLEAAAGAITALYGPSGCGKSTCLRLLAGVVAPAGGEVHTHSRAVLLEQAHAIFLGSVAENVLLRELEEAGPGKESKSRRGDCAAAEGRTCGDVDDERVALRQRVERALGQSGCSGFISDPYRVRIDNVESPPFSGGQLKRLCLARVFAYGGAHGGCDADGHEGRVSATNCSLVLLDEPTVGLDALTVQQLLKTIVELRDVHGMTVLISTHDDRVAEVADRVIDMAR